MNITKRISEIDYIRGWAILGILLVNVFSLGASDIFRNDFLESWHAYPLEKALLFLRSNILDNRVFPILSFLFGWGVGMQILTAKSSTVLYKRQFVLLCFGLIHGLLIWWGDVLILYAFCGIVILLLKKQSDKLLWGIIIFLALFPFYRSISNSIEIESILSYFGFAGLDKEKLVLTVQSADFITFLKVNFLEFSNTNIKSTPFFLPKQLIMVLIGYLVSTKGNLVKLLSSYSSKVWIYIILVVLILMRIAGQTLIVGGISNPVIFYFIEIFLRAVELTTSVIYILVIHRIYCSRLSLGLSHLFISVGRMSLTNYILHSIIGISIFYLFGLYGLLLPSRLLLVALLMFISTSLFSIIWLKNHKNGPLEFLWRKLANRKGYNTK